MSQNPSPLTPKQIEIADAALRIIGTQGITALTIAVLAAELGVSQGAPFRHFANREEILDAVVRRVEEVILSTFPGPMDSPLARIAALLQARAGAVGRHTGIARLMFSDQVAMALPKLAAKRLRNLVMMTRAFLLDALDAAAKAGEIRTDLSPASLLPIVLGTLQILVFARSLGVAKDSEALETCNTLFALLSAHQRCG